VAGESTEPIQRHETRGDMTDDRTDASRGRRAPDTTRTWYLSAALFGIAAAIWLISGNGTAMGLMFVLLAAAMAAAGWSLGNRR